MSIAKRNAANRRKGKSWEHDIEVQLRELGFKIDRTRDSGEKDQGDLAIDFGDLAVVVEAKNAGKFEPGPFLNEAHLEAIHYAEKRPYYKRAFGVVFGKRRGKGKVVDGFALMDIGTAMELMRHYKPEA